MHFPPRLLLALALAAAPGCRRGPVVFVSNQSGTSVSNLVLSGNGFSHTLPSLAHGASASFNIRPASASPIRLAFHSGRPFDSGSLGYLEDSSFYRVGLVIRSNGVVSLQDPAP